MLHEVLPLVAIAVTPPLLYGLVVFVVGNFSLVVAHHQARHRRHDISACLVVFFKTVERVLIVHHPVEVILFQFELLGSITISEVVIVELVAHGHVGIEIHSQFLLGGFLCYNHYYTIRCPCTIYGGCGGILQHCYLLHVVWVYI